MYWNIDQYKVCIKKRKKRNKKSKYLEILGTTSASEFLVNFYFSYIYIYINVVNVHIVYTIYILEFLVQIHTYIEKC